ncbi:hypothetical protein SKAU_G00213830 [Synaphobranchus kaupii]|uniref:Uncharacterized protein n=1 Tax=Synaphobranchus kaupii TaxID=118154 RepID=A0A9Q1F9F3_SYNKA|nr:hypothetical protein SKAU_G00213830 [Synaphobranchus kaupii]
MEQSSQSTGILFPMGLICKTHRGGPPRAGVQCRGTRRPTHPPCGFKGQNPEGCACSGMGNKHTVPYAYSTGHIPFGV